MNRAFAALVIGVICGAVAATSEPIQSPTVNASSEPAASAAPAEGTCGCFCHNCACVDGECHWEKPQVPPDLPPPTPFSQSQPELYTQPEPPAAIEPKGWQPPAGYTYGGNGWYYPPGYQQSYSSGSSCGPGGCGASRGLFGRRR